jgi:hypothetical protein
MNHFEWVIRSSEQTEPVQWSSIFCKDEFRTNDFVDWSLHRHYYMNKRKAENPINTMIYSFTLYLQSVLSYLWDLYIFED